MKSYWQILDISLFARRSKGRRSSDGCAHYNVWHVNFMARAWDGLLWNQKNAPVKIYPQVSTTTTKEDQRREEPYTSDRGGTRPAARVNFNECGVLIYKGVQIGSVTRVTRVACRATNPPSILQTDCWIILSFFPGFLLSANIALALTNSKLFGAVELPHRLLYLMASIWPKDWYIFANFSSRIYIYIYIISLSVPCFFTTEVKRKNPLLHLHNCYQISSK